MDGFTMKIIFTDGLEKISSGTYPKWGLKSGRNISHTSKKQEVQQ